MEGSSERRKPPKTYTNISQTNTNYEKINSIPYINQNLANIYKHFPNIVSNIIKNFSKY